VACKGKQGKASKYDELMNDLNEFYKSHFSGIAPQPAQTENLWQIITYLAADIQKNIKNNIFLHLDQYLKNIIRMMFITAKFDVPKKIIHQLANEIMFTKIVIETPGPTNFYNDIVWIIRKYFLPPNS